MLVKLLYLNNNYRNKQRNWQHISSSVPQLFTHIKQRLDVAAEFLVVDVELAVVLVDILEVVVVDVLVVEVHNNVMHRILSIVGRMVLEDTLVDNV